VQDSLYVALSAQVALEKRMTTIADNVANMNTVGFRATGVRFADVLSADGQVSFASAGDTFIAGNRGDIRETGNPLDFAVQGEAWFAIDTPAGTVMTRDGRFSLTDNGALVTLEGFPVLDAGGAPLQLDPNDGPPKAGKDGSLRQNGRLVGALGLFEFNPGPNFRRYGNSGILPAGEPQPIVDRVDAGVAQGYVEDANVNPVLEMSRLIEVQRAFDSTAALIRDTESSFNEAIRTLGSKS
jgi:flagellar basal-body rod protein FlgF